VLIIGGIVVFFHINKVKKRKDTIFWREIVLKRKRKREKVKKRKR